MTEPSAYISGKMNQFRVNSVSRNFRLWGLRIILVEHEINITQEDSENSWVSVFLIISFTTDYFLYWYWTHLDSSESISFSNKLKDHIAFCYILQQPCLSNHKPVSTVWVSTVQYNAVLYLSGVDGMQWAESWWPKPSCCFLLKELPFEPSLSEGEIICRTENTRRECFLYTSKSFLNSWSFS